METNADKNSDLKKDPRAGVDFVSSMILMLFSLGMILRSFQMPRPAGWASAPGVIPLFVSACLFFMGLYLLIVAIQNDGPARLKSVFIKKTRSMGQSAAAAGLKRSLWIVFFVAIYVFIMLERIPFEIASFVYLVSAFYIFWRRGGWLKILLISAIAPFFISFMFRFVFRTLVPGESLLGWFFD